MGAGCCPQRGKRLRQRSDAFLVSGIWKESDLDGICADRERRSAGAVHPSCLAGAVKVRFCIRSITHHKENGTVRRLASVVQYGGRKYDSGAVWNIVRA